MRFTDPDDSVMQRAEDFEVLCDPDRYSTEKVEAARARETAWLEKFQRENDHAKHLREMAFVRFMSYVLMFSVVMMLIVLPDEDEFLGVMIAIGVCFLISAPWALRIPYYARTLKKHGRVPFAYPADGQRPDAQGS